MLLEDAARADGRLRTTLGRHRHPRLLRRSRSSQRQGDRWLLEDNAGPAPPPQIASSLRASQRQGGWWVLEDDARPAPHPRLLPR